MLDCLACLAIVSIFASMVYAAFQMTSVIHESVLEQTLNIQMEIKEIAGWIEECEKQCETEDVEP